MRELALDRHVFASNASAYDTAWMTYGRTAALEGVRASRMEEEVPWGTHTARAERPARLSGTVTDVLDPDNLDRLSSAFLPVDGRFGWSLWGAVGRRRVGSEWRVATHTVLADEGELRALGVHPAGLLRCGGEAGAAPPWLRRLVEGEPPVEPVVLEPVRVVADGRLREALRADRLAEVRRLRDRLLDAGRNPGGLAGELAAAAQALAAVVQGGGPGGPAAAGPGGRAAHPGGARTGLRHVAFRGAADGPLLVRLLWLALPLEDRLAVFYVSEQRRAERPRAHLLGLPVAEWGRYVPDGAWLAGESDPVCPPSPGRSRWARLLADPASDRAFDRLDRRCEARRWRLVTADDLRPPAELAAWREAWAGTGPSLEGVRELLALERRGAGGPSRPGGGRWRAAGAALCEALRRHGSGVGSAPPEEGRGRAGDPAGGGGGDDEGLARAALDLALEAPSAAAVPVLRGLVRGLLRRRSGAAAALAGRIRCGAAERGGEAMARELHRLAGRESEALRALLGVEGGPEAVARGALSLAAAGDAVGVELLRLAGPDVAWQEGAAVRLAAVAEPGAPGVAGALADLLETLARARPGDGSGPAFGGLAAAASVLVPLLDPAAVQRLVEGDPPPTLAFPLLMATSRTGRDAGGAGARLVGRIAGKVDPARIPGPWRDLLQGASAAWLAREDVLGALAAALRAGSSPFGAGDPRTAALAGVAAARVLERAPGGGLSGAQADALLRLLWLAADPAPLGPLAGSGGAGAAALLAQLLVAAPEPLDLLLREALSARLDAGASPGALAPWAEPLRACAPALAARLRPGDGTSARRVLVGGVA